MLTRAAPQCHGYCLLRPSCLSLTHAEFSDLLSQGLLCLLSLPQATSPLVVHWVATTLSGFRFTYRSITCPLPYILLLLTILLSCLLPLRPHRPLGRAYILKRSFPVAEPAPHSKPGDPCPWVPLYQLTTGLGVPVTRHASLTVSPSSAVQSANSSSKSGGPEDT